MAIDIKFDLANNPELPTIILATRNGKKLGQLEAKEVEVIDKLVEASEITFVLNKYVDGKITNLWDKVVDFKLVYCKEWDLWFEIRVELDEETETIKTVFCTQLGQAELSQIMLYDIEINTEADIARDDYKISILYDPEDSQASILGRIFKKAPHYSIIYIDPSLINIQRSFSFDDTSIYDACQEIAEEIGCLFVFHSDSDENGKLRRVVSVYDLQQSCNKCGHRGEFIDKCTKCGSTDIKMGYGEDTLIFVTADELASNGISLVTDTESVKNCFKLEAGDDLMTATIRNRNPNGTDYIWYFSDAMKADMPSELIEKIEQYDKDYQYYYKEHESNLDDNLLASYNNLVTKYSVYNEDLQQISNPIIGFASLMNAYYNTIDLSWYLKSGLMPNVKMGKTNAEEQGLLLSTTLPPLIAVTSLKTVSKATADSSILMMARAIVNSHYKVTISSSSMSKDKEWSGVFVVENYSDEEDTYTTGTVSRYLTDYDETYIKQKIDKMLSKENSDDVSITGLFEKDYDEFCVELKKYALTPLTSFRDACQACIDILIEQGVGADDRHCEDCGINANVDIVTVDSVYTCSECGGTNIVSDDDLYVNLYLPYYEKLKAIEAEMKVREDELNIILGIYDSEENLVTDGLQTNIEKLKAKIQDMLNFEGYLGKELWLEFCAYRREDKYSNSNYISDGLNNAELFERALEFYEVAENEIYKSSELQHSISATLNNLLAIPKFKPLVKSFSVGNWIRVQIDDRVYKLRLLEYEISFGNFNNINVEFSDVSKTKNGYSDVEDILSEASSMASSYDSVKRQANQGNEARSAIRQWLAEGLDASLVQIQNNTNEDIVIDNNGLLGRSYSDIMGEYSPEQIRLTHNIIAYTDDDWKTVKQAIGKHKYKYYDEGEKEFTDAIGYGISAEFVTAGFVSGSQIIGGNIYSDNYSITDCTGSYLNLRDGTFSFGGGILRFEIDKETNKGKLIISSEKADSNVTELNDEWLKTTKVHAKELVVSAGNVTGKLTAAEIDAGKITSGTLVGRGIRGGNLLISSVFDENGIPQKPTQNENGTYNGTYAEITDEGVLNCNNVNLTGKIIATEGEIGGCEIIDGVLQINNAVINESLIVGALPDNIAYIDGEGNVSTTTIVGGEVTTNTVTAINVTATNAITARELSGETINLLDASKTSVGTMIFKKSETYAFDIASANSLRILATNGYNTHIGVKGVYETDEYGNEVKLIEAAPFITLGYSSYDDDGDGLIDRKVPKIQMGGGALVISPDWYGSEEKMNAITKPEVGQVFFVLA